MTVQEAEPRSVPKAQMTVQEAEPRFVPKAEMTVDTAERSVCMTAKALTAQRVNTPVVGNWDVSY